MGDRLIIVKQQRNSYGNGRDPGNIVGPLVKYIKETPQRIYVEVVKSTGGDYWSLAGPRGKHYIEKDQILADNASIELWEELILMDSHWGKFYEETKRDQDSYLKDIRTKFMNELEKKVNDQSNL